MSQFVIVYLNDSRVIGPFKSVDEAATWVSAVPNSLFKTTEELEHADVNADFYITVLEEPK